MAALYGEFFTSCVTFSRGCSGRFCPNVMARNRKLFTLSEVLDEILHDTDSGDSDLDEDDELSDDVSIFICVTKLYFLLKKAKK